MYNGFYGDLEMINKISKDADWFSNIKLSQLTMEQPYTMENMETTESARPSEVDQIMQELTNKPILLGQAIEMYPDYSNDFKEAASDAWAELLMRQPTHYKIAYNFYRNDPSTLELLTQSALQGLLSL